MRSIAHVGTPLAMVILAAACGRSESPAHESAASSNTVSVFRGYALYRHEVRAFTPCDSMLPLWVVDSSQALWTPYRELALDPADTLGLFAVVQARRWPAPEAGLGAGYAGTLMVDRVLYIAREGYGCAAPWDRFAFRAFGSEPFWSLTIVADSITLIRPGAPERSWYGGQRVSRPEGLTYAAGDPASGGVTVLLTNEPCRDPMAGSYFGYTATVRLGGDSMMGCGLPGSGR